MTTTNCFECGGDNVELGVKHGHPRCMYCLDCEVPF